MQLEDFKTWVTDKYMFVNIKKLGANTIFSIDLPEEHHLLFTWYEVQKRLKITFDNEPYFIDLAKNNIEDIENLVSSIFISHNLYYNS